MDWAESSPDGDISHCPFSPEPKVWNQLSCHNDTCSRVTCPFPRQCFLSKARERLANADVIITNHHLLLSDLKLKTQSHHILPNYNTLILDEAHRLGDASEQCFSIKVRNQDIKHLQRLMEQNYAYMPVSFASELSEQTQQLIQVAQTFFSDYFANRSQTFLIQEPLEEQLWPLTGQLIDIKTTLDSLFEHKQKRRSQTHPSLEHTAQMCLQLANDLDIFSCLELEQYAFWGESFHHLHILQATPLNLANVLQNHLFTGLNQVILTSATLATHRGLDYNAKKMGLPHAELVQIETPFDLPKQMHLKITDDPHLLPQSDNYLATLTAYCRTMILETQGGCFVLFTNDTTMRHVHEALNNELLEQDLRILCQSNANKNDILNQFDQYSNCVLFALDSFWTGIDIAGSHLRNVIITKLPFPVPNSPLNQSKMDLLDKNGHNSFQSFMLPEAILKFKQGAGRLIRSQKDRGQLCVLDPRLCTKPYGALFLKALQAGPAQKLARLSFS